MNQQTWHVSVTFTAPVAFSEDLPLDVMEDLGKHGAAASVLRDMTGGTVTLTIESDSAANACLDAISLVSGALREHRVEHTVSGVSAMGDGDFEAELNAPAFPEVVGYAEIAELAGVSRQRARQFSEIAGFPKPVIVTGQGPLMAKSAVQHWLQRRHTRRPATTG